MPHIVTLRAMLVPHRIPPFTITLRLSCYLLQHADGITFQSTICSNAIRPVLTFKTVRATKTVTACITTSPFLFLHPASKTGFTRFHILGGTLNFSAIFTTFQFCPVCCSFAPSPLRSSLFFLFVCLFFNPKQQLRERTRERCTAYRRRRLLRRHGLRQRARSLRRGAPRCESYQNKQPMYNNIAAAWLRRSI